MTALGLPRQSRESCFEPLTHAVSIKYVAGTSHISMFWKNGMHLTTRALVAALCVLPVKSALSSNLSVNTWAVTSSDGGSFILVNAHSVQVVGNGELVFTAQPTSDVQGYVNKVFAAGSYKCVKIIHWKSDTSIDSFDVTPPFTASCG